MNSVKESLLLYAVTDRAWVGEKTLYKQVEESLKGGVTCVQLREKEMNDDEFLEEALALKDLCQTYRVPFIINDNVEVAVKCGADGIHVGQDDMQAGDVRSKVGDKILGVSVRTVEEALLAEKNGADYVGVGAMFSTSTKKDAKSVDYNGLKEICQAINIPVVAIGGISKSNMEELSGSGLDGVALVSAIYASNDIEQSCVELKELSAKVVNA